MLLGVQVPGFPGLVGGLVNMSCFGESPHPHHHHPTHHHGGPHLIHPGHHHPRLPNNRIPAGEEGPSPGHSPTERRRPSPELQRAAPHHPHPQRSDRYAPIKRLALVQIHPPRNPDQPFTPFGISDILTGRVPKRKAEDQINGDIVESRKDPSHPAGGHHLNISGLAAAAEALGNLNHGPIQGSIVRPWADSSSNAAGPGRGSPISSRDESESEEEEIEVDDDPMATKNKLTQNNSQSPLDALLQMTSKTFDGMDASSMHSDDSSRRDQLSLFSKSQPAKKRRKSRTAFTNQQIYELEKRFLYQKYLTPADRDEIASSLGLTNAQVITWFQNRRAKLKRDLEELKADVSAARSISPNLAPDLEDMNERHPVYGSLEELQLLQKNNGNIKPSPKQPNGGNHPDQQVISSPQPKQISDDSNGLETEGEAHLENSRDGPKSPTSPRQSHKSSSSIQTRPTSPHHDDSSGSQSPPPTAST